MNAIKDLPNFAAWETKNLADFCTDAYIRMQEQQETIEQLRLDVRDAMVQVRRLTVTISNYLEEPL